MPNWTVWAHVPTVRVWEAVAVSLNIDPKKIRTRPNAWMGNGEHFPHDEGQQFEDRIEVLRRNLGGGRGLPLASIIMGKPDYCEVRIADFARWARSLHWDMPEELAVLAKAPVTPQTAVSDTQGARKEAAMVTAPERLTLRWLIDHMPVSWWWSLAAAFIFIFGVGVSLGQSELYSSLVTPARLSPAGSPAPQSEKEPAPVLKEKSGGSGKGG